MSEATSVTVADFRRILVPFADAERSVAMSAYMKNRFVFFGISKPQRYAATRELVKIAKRGEIAEIRELCEKLWAQKERELHYVALELLQAASPHLSPSDLMWIQDLARRNAWWDSIDTLAPHVIGPIVKRHSECGETIESWGSDADFWIRRVAILHQLAFKKATDRERLFHLCLQNAADKEFFIRKAIGWALREYAKTDAVAVAQFLGENEARFSGLTLREARRHLSKIQNVTVIQED